MTFVTDMCRDKASVDAKVLLIMFYDQMYILLILILCFFLPVTGNVLNSDRFHGQYRCNTTLRRESVTNVEPGAGFDTSRSYRVGGKCAAAVIDGRSWRSVQRRVASFVNVLRVLYAVLYPFGGYALFLVRAVGQSFNCLDINSWSCHCHISPLPHFQC